MNTESKLYHSKDVVVRLLLNVIIYCDMTKDDYLMNLYGKCENVDGYYRDGCVWDNEIDSYDTSTVQVNYDNGTLLTYTMNTNLPYEGQFISFLGEKGRIDIRLMNGQPWEVKYPIEIRIIEDMKTSRIYTMKCDEGGHGGADVRVKDLIFKPDVKDIFQRRAGSRAGIITSLMGGVARESIETGGKIKIKDMVDFKTYWKG